jgi:hypothetical protein
VAKTRRRPREALLQQIRLELEAIKPWKAVRPPVRQASRRPEREEGQEQARLAEQLREDIRNFKHEHTTSAGW